MTEQEKQSIIDAVLSSIRTNSRSIGQLTAVSTLSEGDFFEVAGGKKVSFAVLRDLVSAFANLDAESIKTDVAKMLVQNVAFDVTESAATLTIKQQGYAAKTVSVPVATDNHSGIITAADKVKLESAYTSSQTAITAANNAQKGVTELSNSIGKPSGIATLDGDGKLKGSQVPSNLTTETDIQNLRKSVKEEIGTAKNELDGVINKMKGYGYKFIAEAALDTDPGTPSENIFYICTTPGEYINFPTNMFSGQHETVYFTLGEGEVGLLLYTIPDDTPTISNWSLVKLDLAKGSTVKDIEKQISNISASVKKLDKSVAPRLFFNGNALVGVDSLSLDKFLVLTADDAYADIRKKGVVVALSAGDELKNYQWGGNDWGNAEDWGGFGGSSVSSIFNATNEVPISGYYVLCDTENQKLSAVHAAWNAKKAVSGLIISFEVGSGIWKTYPSQ